MALLFKMNELAEELGRFLCCQNGGGLVEDEDLRAPHERLEDFHLLFHADRDVHDLGMGVDLEVVPFGVLLGEGDRPCIV